ncbi:MAG: hypothetical protein AAGA84_09700, partial [Pseudomonadota bacterium]
MSVAKMSRNLLFLSVVGLLAACGGSSGGGNAFEPPPPVNQAPTAEAGPDQTVARFVTVSLAGSATDDAGTSGLSYAWNQTAGTNVTLNGSDTLTPSFAAPDVSADEDLIFELTVTDVGNLSATDSVTITVLANVAPTADAGPDQSVEQNTIVTLDGSASSDDDPVSGLTYAWTQTGTGPAVVLSDAAAVQPTFTAPSVTGSVALNFRLTVTDAGNATSFDDVVVTVFENLTAAIVSGKARYESVPYSSAAGGLSYGTTTYLPIRRATVQLVDAANGTTVLAQTTTDNNGDYSMTAMAAGTSVFVRVRAELKQAGTPGWDVEVRDNTSNPALDLADRALYVLDGAAFNASPGTQTVDLDAPSGWTGAGYGNTRAAAPFSVLDTIYRGIELVLSADPDVVFPPLDAYWSVNNTPNVGTG